MQYKYTAFLSGQGLQDMRIHADTLNDLQEEIIKAKAQHGYKLNGVYNNEKNYYIY